MSYTLLLAVCVALLGLSAPYVEADDEDDGGYRWYDECGKEGDGREHHDDDNGEWYGHDDDGKGEGDDDDGKADGSGGDGDRHGGDDDGNEPSDYQSSRAGKAVHPRSRHAPSSRSAAHAKSAKARAAPSARKAGARSAKAHKG